MAPAKPTVQMQSVWCQDPVVAHAVHAYVPPIVVVAQVLESAAVVVEVGAATGIVDIVVAADVAVDIVVLSEVADILTEIDHDLSYCLFLCTYHILLWV